MAAALAERGVRLEVRTIQDPHELGPGGYSMQINRTPVDLYRTDPDEPSVPLSDDPWLDCTMRPLSRVNGLLAEAGSHDRVAVFEPGSNDGFAILASPGVLQLLSQAAMPSEQPATP